MLIGLKNHAVQIRVPLISSEVNTGIFSVLYCSRIALHLECATHFEISLHIVAYHYLIHILLPLLFISPLSTGNTSYSYFCID